MLCTVLILLWKIISFWLSIIAVVSLLVKGFGILTLIETVSALELIVPSFTTNEKTRVPVVAGALKVGCEELLFEIVTLVPEVWDHVYVKESPSPSLELVPSNVTVSPEKTVWSGPAFEVGEELEVVKV